MKESIFTFRKKEGQVSVWRKKEMQDLVKSLEDGDYEWVLRKKKKKRSNSQNSYYRAIVLPMVLEGLIDNGYRRSELNLERTHEYLKDKFLKFDLPNEESGDFITIKKDTRDLTTVEMMNFIAEVQMFSIEFLGITIPDPEKQVKLDL